jgi:hypothetical protein
VLCCSLRKRSFLGFAALADEVHQQIWAQRGRFA